MGLDMFAYAVKNEGDFNSDEREELAYWRKHNALHAWMWDLWEEKGKPEFDPETMGGSFGEFNCAPVRLESQDLDRLEAAVIGRKLTPTGGFFWGDTDYSEEDWAYYRKEDLAFIKKAKKAIDDGLVVYYNSWW